MGEPEDDFEKLLSQAEYALAGEQPTTGRLAAAAPVAVATAVAAPQRAAPVSPLLAYAGVVRKPVDEGTEAAKITDLYAPLALIILGVFTYFLDARLYGIHNPAVATGFVLVKSTINLVLVFIALLIGVKLIDLGLEPFGPAMLKITAVALLPAAVGTSSASIHSVWFPGH